MRALRRYAVGAFSPHRRLALAGSWTLDRSPPSHSHGLAARKACAMSANAVARLARSRSCAQSLMNFADEDRQSRTTQDVR
jgi:hypothetical protein